MYHQSIYRISAFLVGLLALAVHTEASAREWNEPAELVEHIVARAPAIEASMTRAQAAERSGGAEAAQLGDTRIEFGGAVLPIETRNGPIRAQITAMQALPQFRARTYREAAMGHRADSLACTAADKRLELRVAAYQKLVTLYALQQVKDELDELYELAVDSIDSTVDESAHNRASQSDVLQAELVAQRIENRQIRVERQVDEAMARLAVWADDRDIALTGTFYETLGEGLDAITDEIREGQLIDEEHPQLARFRASAAAERERASAFLASRRVQAAFMARWSILTNIDEANPTREGRDALMLGVSLSIPTSTREERLRAESANLEAESAERAQQAALEELEASAAELIARYERAREEWQHLGESVIPVAHDRVDALVDELAHESTDYETMLSALQNIVQLTIERWDAWQVSSAALVQLEGVTNGAMELTPWSVQETCSVTAESGGQP